MRIFTHGIILGWLLSLMSTVIGVYVQVNFIDQNKVVQISPIVVECPGQSKQIVFPDATNLDLKL